MRFAVSAVLFAFLVGCGGPKAGDSCNQTGFLCADTDSALECRVGKWTELPCRGPDGCKRTGDQVACDMRGNLEGDACASVAEGDGLCTAAGDGTLQCRLGVLEKTNTCKSCSVSSENKVVCQP